MHKESIISNKRKVSTELCVCCARTYNLVGILLKYLWKAPSISHKAINGSKENWQAIHVGVCHLFIATTKKVKIDMRIISIQRVFFSLCLVLLSNTARLMLMKSFALCSKADLRRTHMHSTYTIQLCMYVKYVINGQSYLYIVFHEMLPTGP